MTISIFQKEKWGSERLSDLPMIIQQVMELGHESMTVWLQGLCFPNGFHFHTY